MGERMRAVDWSSAPLGPLERWPQSLKISVRIMLDSGYPMAICRGRDYMLLYNDALRLMYETKHPAALNRSFTNVFAEGWEAFGRGPRWRHIRNGTDGTARVIADRRRHVLCDLASRTTEVRDEDEVWRVSANTLDEHRLVVDAETVHAMIIQVFLA
jgi:hypothetical protein